MDFLSGLGKFGNSLLEGIRNQLPSTTHSFRREAPSQAGGFGSGLNQQIQAQTPAPAQLQPGQGVASFPGYQQPQSPPEQVDMGAVSNIANSVKTGFGNMLNNLTQPATHSMRFREPTNETLSFKDEGQVFTAPPAPIATPNPALDDGNYRFAFETLPRDQGWTNNGPRPNFNPKQPPAEIGQIIRDVFPNEATTAAAVAASEDGRYEPRAQNLWNDEGQGIDRGIFAINSNTFNGLMQRQGDKLKAMGINSFEDMFDPRKNAQVAKLIKDGSKQANQAGGRDTNGLGPWYGWQDTGYDLNKGYFSKEDRKNYELKKQGKSR